MSAVSGRAIRWFAIHSACLALSLGGIIAYIAVGGFRWPATQAHVFPLIPLVGIPVDGKVLVIPDSNPDWARLEDLGTLDQEAIDRRGEVRQLFARDRMGIFVPRLLRDARRRGLGVLNRAAGIQWVPKVQIAVGEPEVRYAYALVWPHAFLWLTLPTALLALNSVYRAWVRRRRRRLGRCAVCGYSLRGLVEPRCPECGTVFA